MTTQDYTDAILQLIKIARRFTGGSSPAAQVLLSAYNGYDFHISIRDLCVLDQEGFKAAMTVIRGRTLLSVEPHNLIADGDRVFSELYDHWPGLHVQNRWKRSCYDCNGSGRVYVDDDCEQTKECYRCDGRGRIAEIEWPGYDS